MSTLRVGSWNLQQRAGDAAAHLGSVFADTGGADLVLLQEASQGGLGPFCTAGGLDWHAHVRDWFPDLLGVRGRAGGVGSDGVRHANPRAVAIAGRGAPIRGVVAFPDLPLPEKLLAGWIEVGGVRVTVVNYHAPTGVQHGARKAQQALRVAAWLASLDGPVILGGDFNTPLVDPIDPAGVVTHWFTGMDQLDGAPGDDVLVGASPIHPLRDAYRTYLRAQPEEVERIRLARPGGPLAVSHRTGDGDGHRFRYDAIWLSPHFEVSSVQYQDYDEAVAAGTDHSFVIADVSLRPVGSVV